jgi:hypothetical protein
MITKFDDYLHKKLSVENLLEKLLEVDKIQYLFLNENELYYFKMIPNSQIFLNDDSYIQKLYKQFEFFQKKEDGFIIPDEFSSINTNLKRILL